MPAAMTTMLPSAPATETALGATVIVAGSRTQATDRPCCSNTAASGSLTTPATAGSLDHDGGGLAESNRGNSDVGLDHENYE